MATARRTTGERRTELADAALEIIATRGIVELTTKNLADAVGLSTGAIFRHFASLDALFVALAERVAEVLDETYPSPELPPLERLEKFLEARSSVVGERAGILRLMLSDQFALALPEAAALELRHARATTRAFLVATITEAQAAGQVRRDVAPEELVVIVMGTIQMLGLSAAGPHARGPTQARAVRAALLQLITEPARPARRRPT